jgi:hypothetical protein
MTPKPTAVAEDMALNMPSPWQKQVAGLLIHHFSCLHFSVGPALSTQEALPGGE